MEERKSHKYLFKDMQEKSTYMVENLQHKSSHLAKKPVFGQHHHIIQYLLGALSCRHILLDELNTRQCPCQR